MAIEKIYKGTIEGALQSFDVKIICEKEKNDYKDKYTQLRENIKRNMEDLKMMYDLYGIDEDLFRWFTEHLRQKINKDIRQLARHSNELHYLLNN
jgi:hypothetical protein